MTRRQLVSNPDAFEIGAAQFFDTHRSPSGAYLVGTGGAPGACALIDRSTGEVCFHNQLQRPRRPFVDDEGRVMVIDDLNLGRPSGAVLAADRRGQLRWRIDLEVNIVQLEASADVHHAVVVLAAGRPENLLFVDALTGEVLWSRRELGRVAFAGNTLEVSLRMSDGSAPRFTMDAAGEPSAGYAEALAKYLRGA